MKEIIGKTKKGKLMIGEIVEEIKKEMTEDDFNETMGDDHFTLDELY